MCVCVCACVERESERDSMLASVFIDIYEIIELN